MLKIVTDYSFVGNKSCIACSYDKLPTSVKPGTETRFVLTRTAAQAGISCKLAQPQLFTVVAGGLLLRCSQATRSLLLTDLSLLKWLSAARTMS